MGCTRSVPVDENHYYQPLLASVQDLYWLRTSLVSGCYNYRIPLTRVTFNSVIQDSVCRTEVTQVYWNVESGPIECEYVFPVLQDAAVVGLKVQTGNGAVLEARVEDLEEAKEGYSDAIASGDQAVMGRMETEDRMVIHVGNMAPKSQVKVMFTLVHPVKCEGKVWSFVLPAALLPLFNLGNSLASLGINEIEDVPVPTLLGFVRPSECTYTMHFRLTIQSSSPITHCECLSHTVAIDNPAPHLQATVYTREDSVVLANTDFRVRYETRDAMVPQVNVQYNPARNEYAAVLSFLPPLLDPGEEVEDLTGTGEFILLLDRSGSMIGKRIEMAREATQLFIKSLSSTCVFNVISFGDNTSPLFPSSQLYSAKSVQFAIEAVSRFEGDMGGTEILKSLRVALAVPSNPALPRSIYLLTDGDVFNQQEVIMFVQREAKHVRVHTFGIGEGASTALIKGVAKAGNGIAEFISNPTEIKAKVISSLQKGLMPALTNNTLKWPCKGSQYPSNECLSTCYFGEVFQVFAHFGTSPPTPGQFLTLSSCNSKTGQSVSFEVVIGPNIVEGNSIHLLWAKQAIKELTSVANHRDDTSAKKEAIRISKEFGIPSMYTAFLCAESRVVPVNGPLQLRKVPILSMRCEALLKSRRCSNSIESDIIFCSGSSEKCVRDEYKHTAKTGLMQLVETQQIEGNWSLCDLSSFLSVSQCPERIRAEHEVEAEDIWATVCAVLILRLKHASEEGEWKLLARKATRWLKARGVANVAEYSDLVSSLLIT